VYIGILLFELFPFWKQLTKGLTHLPHRYSLYACLLPALLSREATGKVALPRGKQPMAAVKAVKDCGERSKASVKVAVQRLKQLETAVK